MLTSHRLKAQLQLTDMTTHDFFGRKPKSWKNVTVNLMMPTDVENMKSLHRISWQSIPKLLRYFAQNHNCWPHISGLKMEESFFQEKKYAAGAARSSRTVKIIIEQLVSAPSSPVQLCSHSLRGAAFVIKTHCDSIEMKLEQIGWLILFVHGKTGFQNSLIFDSGALKCCHSSAWWMRISQRLFAQRCLGKKKSSYELMSWKTVARELCGLLALLLWNARLRPSYLLLKCIEIHIKCGVEENISRLTPYICSVNKISICRDWGGTYKSTKDFAVGIGLKMVPVSGKN